MIRARLFFSLWKYNKQRQKKEYFCYAPYSSLFFDYKGNVFPCFANKHLILGRYGSQSITEIWKDVPINNLRKSIENHSFHLGCNLCQNKLLQHNFSQVYAHRYDYLSVSENGFPTSIEVQLSNQCNLDCIMCVVRNDYTSNMDIPAFKNYIREIIPYLKNASFSGGEPFLIKEYFDIWEDFYRLNKDCRISVNTNATILDEKVKNILGKLKFNISVSVDGFSKETFEGIRKKASRDMVYENLHFFKDYTQQNNTFFNVKICALKQNIHEFPDLFNYFNQQDISIILNEVVYPLNTALWNNKPDELKRIIDFLISYTPAFKSNGNIYSNSVVWKELLKMLHTYYQNALKFETFIQKNISLTKSIKEKVYKKVRPVFANQNELNHFISIIDNYTQNEKYLKTLYFFFLIAPFERMIGEIEVRNEQEVKKIFDNIINYFEWS
jgi:sulfatase maturation enzyme AslB (radical SAM superfamily)